MAKCKLVLVMHLEYPGADPPDHETASLIEKMRKAIRVRGSRRDSGVVAFDEGFLMTKLESSIQKD